MNIKIKVCKKEILFCAIAALNLLSCDKTEDTITCKLDCNKTEELIFQSGFEASTTGLPLNAMQIFSGIDNSVPPPNDWVNDLENHSNIGTFDIQYQGGDVTERYAKIITDPTGSANKVLHFWLKEPNVDGTKGRIQANIYDNNCLIEVYHTSRLFLHSDFNILQNSPETFDWLTLFEYWNNAGWTSEEYPFRITINIEKRDNSIGSPLYFGVHAQTYNGSSWNNNVWDIDNTDTPIVFNQWLTTEVYFKEGDNNSGRFYFAITPEGGNKKVIFDITDFTHHPEDPCPDGLTHFNPMKLYTSDELLNYMTNNGGILQVYWDNFQLWKNHIP